MLIVNQVIENPRKSLKPSDKAAAIRDMRHTSAIIVPEAIIHILGRDLLF